jgi:hypothetical protein
VVPARLLAPPTRRTSKPIEEAFSNLLQGEAPLEEGEARTLLLSTLLEATHLALCALTVGDAKGRLFSHCAYGTLRAHSL